MTATEPPPRPARDWDQAWLEGVLWSILDSTSEGILIAGLERVYYFNRRFAELWRIPADLHATSDELQLRRYALDQLEDPGGFVAGIEQLARSRIEARDTLRLKDGRVYERRARPIVQDGALTGHVLSFRDVTEEQRAVEELRRSEATNRALLDAIPDMMFRLTRDRRFVDFIGAKGLEPVVPPSEFIGKEVSEVLPPEVASQALHQIGRAMETGAVQSFEYELAVAGEPHFYEARIVVSGEDEVLAIVRDVTERKRMEETLRQSEQGFRLLAENAQDAIFRYRLTEPGGLEYISPAMEAISGYTPEECVADPGLLLTIVHPDDRETFTEMLDRRVTDPVEVRWVRKDGTVVWTERRNTFVYDDAGRLVAVEGIIRDITDRKRMEEALHWVREELEGKVEHQMRRRNPYGLTFREFTVLHLVAAGKTDKEIARELGISPLTVHKHVSSILARMSASSRTEAGVRALREGLLG